MLAPSAVHGAKVRVRTALHALSCVVDPWAACIGHDGCAIAPCLHARPNDMIASVMQPWRNASWLMVTAGRHTLRKSDSCHTDIISITIRQCPDRRNAMKPRFRCVLTHWRSGFELERHDHGIHVAALPPGQITGCGRAPGALQPPETKAKSQRGPRR